MATRKTPIDLSEDSLDETTLDRGARAGDQERTRGRMPSISTMVRYMSPEAIAERRRKARENFGRVTPVPNGVQQPADGGPLAEDVPEPERTSGPSPWAKETGFDFDKAALPSAAMPARTSSPTDLEPSQDHKVAPPGAGSRRHTWIIVALCAVVAVVGPILMLMAARTRKPVEQGGGIATASVPDAPSAMRSTSAPAPTTSASVAPALTAVPSSAPTADAAPSGVPAAVTARPGPAPERLPAPPVRKAAQTAADAGESTPPPQPKPTSNGDPLLNE